MNANIQMTSRREIKDERGHNAASLKIDVDLLQSYWTKLRCSDTCLFKVVKFDGFKCVEHQRGWLPQGDEKKDPEKVDELLARSDALGRFANDCARAAYERITKTCDFYEKFDNQNGFYSIFGKSVDGVVGLMWANDGDLAKAKLLASFALYVIGLSSVKSDNVLWEAAYRHLPYHSSIDLKVADEMFAHYLAM